MIALFMFLSLSCVVLSWFLGSSENAFANLIRKGKLLLIGATHMLLSRDKKSKVQHDPDIIEVDSHSESRRIVFLRHGESEWNEVFNRGFDFSFVIRLLRALFREFLLLPTRDSVFFDSPLSDTGIRQAQELVRFLERTSNSTPVIDPKVDEIISILNGENTFNSIVTTSNLRRSIATGFIAMWERLRKTGERYYVLSMLQEITLNVDGISLLEANEIPDSSISNALGYEITFNGEFNTGTKSLSSNGYTRMSDFCKFAFNRQEKTIVCNGHSGWFRDFFRNFLPFNCNHISKKRKLINCGVISFVLLRGKVKHLDAYRIDPDSIVVVYGGFERK